MTREQLQLQIAEYASGLLEARDRASIERELGANGDARAFLAQEERLTALLRTEPVPEIDFTALARRVQTATATMPIPARRMTWTTTLSPVRLALAASVLIAAGAAIPLLSRSTADQPSLPPVVAVPAESLPVPRPTIVVRAVDEDRNPAVESIKAGDPAPGQSGVAVGPSPGIRPGEVISRYADATTRPSRVDIDVASPPATAQDSR